MKPVAAPLAGELPQEEGGGQGPQNAWKFIVAFLIVLAVIVGYTAWNGYHTQQLQDANRYHGFDFAQAGSGDNLLWVTRLQVRGQAYDVPFYYHPRELEDILADPTSVDPIFSKPEMVYVSVHPDAGSRPVVAAVEVSRILGTKYKMFNLPVSSALSAPGNTSADYPIRTCADASNTTTVIQLIYSDKDAVVHNGNCVMLLYTSPEESIRVADRYAYMLLQIMP